MSYKVMLKGEAVHKRRHVSFCSFMVIITLTSFTNSPSTTVKTCTEKLSNFVFNSQNLSKNFQNTKKSSFSHEKKLFNLIPHLVDNLMLILFHKRFFFHFLKLPNNCLIVLRH